MTILDREWFFSGWVLLLIAIILVLYLWGTSTYKRFSKQNIPYVKPLPFVGTMGKTMYNKEAFPQYVLDMYNQLKGHPYGGIFVFRNPVLMLRDPEIIKTITVKDFEYFTDHRTMIQGTKYDEAWNKGLFNLEGQRWKEMRSTLSPAFTSSKMKTMFVLISECCQQLVQFLEQCYTQMPDQSCSVQKEGDLLILELKDLYTRYTTDVIATTAFGIGVDSLKQPTNEFYTMGQNATSSGEFQILKFLLFMIVPKLAEILRVTVFPKKVTDFFRSLVRDTISTREREGIVRPDVLQLLIQAKKGTLQDENSGETNKSTKIKLDDEDILAQVLPFFLAGFDTVSTLLCFTSHQLAVHPDVQTRLQEEVDKTLQENNGKFTYETIQSMKYLDMVVSETLRLYPPEAAVDRVCVKDYTLKTDPPVKLRTGEGVYLPIFALHRDPQYFQDPERFDPERFSDENKHKINPMTYLPFGVGPRICIGNRFALMESKLALAYIMSKFSLRVVSKTPIPIKIEQNVFSITIKGGFWLGIEQRNP